MGWRNESGLGDASSPHRRRSHRSNRHNDEGGVGDGSNHHRHWPRDSDSLDDRHRGSHRHRRGSAEGRRGKNEATRSERVSRSHRRPRRERSDSDNEYDSLDDDRLSRRWRRRHGQQRRERSQSEDDYMNNRHGRREKGKRHRDLSATDDDGLRQSRKYHRDGRPVVDELSHSSGDNAVADSSDCRAYRERPQAGNSVTNPSHMASSTVDWSSRHRRQRMPGLAYDVDQQKRFLGFLDRRDASGGQAAAAAMEFTVGADGLVQMPPPPMLVRRQNRNRFGATDSNDGSGSGFRRQQQKQHRQRSTLSCAALPANAHGEDSNNSSVASHESLYNNPATAQLGILPDIIPPSNLYRVALYGVDLSLTASHLSSMVAQLLGGGVKPWRVRRPAREMLHAAVCYNHTAQQQPQYQQPLPAPLTSRKSAVTNELFVSGTTLVNESANAASSSGVLGDPPGSITNTSHSIETSTIGVLLCESSIAEGGGVLPDAEDRKVTSGVLGSVAEKTSGVLQGEAGRQQMHKEGEENNESVLPDALSLPQPLQPATPAVYLPGLHDVNGPGGMVVLEFTEQKHALRSVQLLNGAYVNGRRVAASM
ncbi:hypothetical protein MNV84_07320 [Leishmania braziliensis]|nr:hypothetical protein MNV84_07320 [Leishmania braziliensis]